MDTRSKILNAVAANKPAMVALAGADINAVIHYDDVAAQFKTVLEGIGGKVIEINNVQQLQQEIENEKQSGNFIVNTVAEWGEVDSSLASSSAEQLAGIHKAFIKGTLGIAENGSVWIKESQMLNRLIPFICQHLVLAIEKKSIVATMHHAYQQVNVFEEGFGTFLAGPSKTADIEQSLVIGAHGARSLVVYVIGE
jgi:L-lactate dehydrogenase complex protein LldG